MKKPDLMAPEWFRTLPVCGSRARTDLLDGAVRAEEIGLPLLINVQTKEDIARAHELGYKCLTYIALMDVFITDRGDPPRLERHGRVAWDKRKAGMLLLDWRGRPVNTFMDGSKRMARFVACTNTREYTEGAFALVQDVMEMGTDGLFIDNAGPRLECHGHGTLIGYSEKYRTVIVARPGMTQYDPEVRKLSVHEHLRPELDHNTAYELLLAEVRGKVRECGEDKVVVKNGEGFADAVDAVMLESYICSWAWNKRNMTRTRLRSLAQQYRPYIDSGHQVVALSFLGHTPNEVKDDAYFCYAAAKVSGFIWTDYQTMGPSEARNLYPVRLGEPTSDLLSNSGVDYRLYEHGIVALNMGEKAKRLRLKLSGSAAHEAYEDVYTGTHLRPERQTLTVEVPPDSGRVYTGV